jgi:hypothetical protein
MGRSTALTTPDRRPNDVHAERMSARPRAGRHVSALPKRPRVPFVLARQHRLSATWIDRPKTDQGLTQDLDLFAGIVLLFRAKRTPTSFTGTACNESSTRLPKRCRLVPICSPLTRQYHFKVPL